VVEAARPEIEKQWRRVLAFSHPCVAQNTALYGDDGELCCNACFIDFRRDSLDEIETKIVSLAQKREEGHAARKAEIERKAKIEALKNLPHQWLWEEGCFVRADSVDVELLRLRGGGG